MGSITHIDEIAAIIRRAEEQAEARGYARGRGDERAAMLAILQRGPSQELPVGLIDHAGGDSAVGEADRDKTEQVERLPSDRKRAPKGLVPKFVQRVLAEHRGLTPKGIVARASDDYERMIKPASVRGELRQGMDHGRYTTDDGRWYLVSEEAEGNALESKPSASNTDNGGTSNAAALDLDPFG